MTDAVSTYADIVERLSAEPGVWHSDRKGFGRNGLKINDRMFALLIGEDLLLKLPRSRVDWLIASGDGKPFDPTHGGVMKEWVLARPSGAVPWLDLAREAMAFVSSAPPGNRRG